ncbi:hypothetical protein [Flavobacterium sp.]|uniref:hypothetical protein n=1 Tax=Flavobacterium sp. TaxID=239 RepID=UPI00262FF9D2|nr:hypothetical protein [Flavobacterium sp.]
MKQFNNLLNYFSAIILFMAVLGFMFLSYNHLKKEDPPKKIIISYSTNKDSLNKYSEFNKIDSLVKELKNISNSIHERQIKEIKEDEEKDFFNKFYSIVVAVILVIAGFFGYKNISEIKQKAIEDAKEAAEIKASAVAETKAIEVSEREFNLIFTQQYRAEVMAQATQAFSETFETEYARIHSLYIELDRRIQALEPPIDPNLDNENDLPNDDENLPDNDADTNEPLNPFGNE